MNVAGMWTHSAWLPGNEGTGKPCACFKSGGFQFCKLKILISVNVPFSPSAPQNSHSWESLTNVVQVARSFS